MKTNAKKKGTWLSKREYAAYREELGKMFGRGSVRLKTKRSGNRVQIKGTFLTRKGRAFLSPQLRIQSLTTTVLLRRKKPTERELLQQIAVSPTVRAPFYGITRLAPRAAGRELRGNKRRLYLRPLGRVRLSKLELSAGVPIKEITKTS